MSHTDKTRPGWVQVRDPLNRWGMREEHDHRNGVCDYDEWWQAGVDPWDWRNHRRWQCHLDYSYYGINVIKMFPRPPKHCWGRQGPHDALRAQWRRDRQRLLKAIDPDDIDYVTPGRKEFVKYGIW